MAVRKKKPQASLRGDRSRDVPHGIETKKDLHAGHQSTQNGSVNSGPWWVMNQVKDVIRAPIKSGKGHINSGVLRMQGGHFTDPTQVRGIVLGT